MPVESSWCGSGTFIRMSETVDGSRREVTGDTCTPFSSDLIGGTMIITDLALTTEKKSNDTFLA